MAVARKGQAPLSQIAKDFGISEGSLANWMKQAGSVALTDLAVVVRVAR